jgi:hypothetical protein
MSMGKGMMGMEEAWEDPVPLATAFAPAPNPPTPKPPAPEFSTIHIIYLFFRCVMCKLFLGA